MTTISTRAAEQVERSGASSSERPLDENAPTLKQQEFGLKLLAFGMLLEPRDRELLESLVEHAQLGAAVAAESDVRGFAVGMPWRLPRGEGDVFTNPFGGPALAVQGTLESAKERDARKAQQARGMRGYVEKTLHEFARLTWGKALLGGKYRLFALERPVGTWILMTKKETARRVPQRSGTVLLAKGYEYVRVETLWDLSGRALGFRVNDEISTDECSETALRDALAEILPHGVLIGYPLGNA